ncbi:MAG: DUF2975 domain-containing protein [Cyclobacteriaceae bacterium]
MRIFIRITQALTYLTLVFLFTLTCITLLITARFSEQFGHCNGCTRSYTVYSYIGLLNEFGFYEKADDSGSNHYLITDQIEYTRNLSEDLKRTIKTAGYDLLQNAKVTTNNIPISRTIYEQVKTTFILSHTLVGLLLLTILYILHHLLEAFRKGEYFKHTNHKTLNFLGFMIILFPAVQYVSHHYIYRQVVLQDKIEGLRPYITGMINVNWVLIAIGIMTIIFSSALKKGWEIKRENELTI